MVNKCLIQMKGFTANHEIKLGFKNVCRIAVVAARPLACLQNNEVDIFFGEANEIEIDPQIEWIMVSDFHTQRVLFANTMNTVSPPSLVYWQIMLATIDKGMSILTRGVC